ncbi:Adenylylsulfate kinase [Mycolicibacterium mageritense DSM 44476 = CIP 104973]|uniref:APS kinase domain-containing protein n=1 Tax=Mycolicibacterium mageritense TaxID=53462 RepID=A0AAI8XQ50_MYCME|nr:hypothetical protein hbim_04482 [Mycolicibacterium mageritense]CDO19855.1 Adenylylsulfate kinase [Mycolicibacterium mageritense DSM 44476 = CIP 104973]
MLPVVWLVGTSGVGKSTVGWQVRADLAAAGVAAAFVDSDQLRLAVGLGGAFETELIARSLRALEPGYRDAGAALLVVAGLADDPAHLSELLPGVRRADILVCHLHADDAAIRDRILRRGWQVYLAGSEVEYATRIDRGWADLRIDTSTLSPGDVAATVSRAALAHLRRVPRGASRDAAEGTDGRSADGLSARVLLLAGPGGVGTSTIGVRGLQAAREVRPPGGIPRPSPVGFCRRGSARRSTCLSSVAQRSSRGCNAGRNRHRHDCDHR